MTKCDKCGVSVMEIPIIRVNPIGVAGLFWCEPCLKKHEPELHSNQTEDLTEVEKILIKNVKNNNNG